MGLGREIATEMMIDRDIAYAQHINRLMMSLWTMEDGKLISVGDMETQHIVNCINMLKVRPDDIARMWVERFRQELRERLNSINISEITFITDDSC